MSVKLRALAPAKVNLCLFLGGTRSDRRHELVTLLQSLSFADQLVLVTLDAGASDQVLCPEVQEENLAQRAITALRERGWAGPPVMIRIDKRIPVAAGMGGGSADAAAALRLAIAIAAAPPAELDAVAATLGADVPSQLVPGLVLGTGAGDEVERLEPLEPHAYVIVPSPERLSTADVYREADRLGLSRSSAELRECHGQLVAALSAGGRLAGELIVNDLQPAALSLCPSIAEGLGAVREAGADQVIVSGSGPTVAGVFWGHDAPARAELAARELVGAHPGAIAATPVAPPFGVVEAVQT